MAESKPAMEKVRISGKHLPECGRIACVLRRPDEQSAVIVPMPSADDPEPAPIMVDANVIEAINGK